jgi:coenzyme F420-0:L-glutamate ligase/coenzyme F420-1:gamma-L-glutamate ligase
MELFAPDGVPEVREGDDLAALVEAAVDLRAGDVLCVASTVVSKAEGRTVDLADVTAGERAREVAERLERVTGEAKDPRFAQVVIEESNDLVLESPFLLTETRFGHITVNAGIDRSNVPEADLLLLPEDPAGSARRLHEALGVPVVVTDTCGRPFRHGQRGVAIGWAGLPASRDWRGERDRDGRELGVTVEAVVDELAAAANLLTGEGDDGLPVVVVRGFEFGDHEPHDGLFRSEGGDYVRDALRQWTFDGGSGGPETGDGP